MLAHNAAELGLPLDPIHLYDVEPGFLVLVEGAVEALHATRERQRQERERQGY